MDKLADNGNIDLNQVFVGNDRDLNRLFPDLSLKRFLKEMEQHKREVKIEDEGDG
jgi:hypothetical protein